MAKNPSVDRRVWNAVTRREAADAILDASNPVEEFRETAHKHKLQAYQLYAWVGQAAIARKSAASKATAAPPAGDLASVLMRQLPADVLAKMLTEALRKG